MCVVLGYSCLILSTHCLLLIFFFLHRDSKLSEAKDSVFLSLMASQCSRSSALDEHLPPPLCTQLFHLIQRKSISSNQEKYGPPICLAQSWGSQRWGEPNKTSSPVFRTSPTLLSRPPAHSQSSGLLFRHVSWDSFLKAPPSLRSQLSMTPPRPVMF